MVMITMGAYGAAIGCRLSGAFNIAIEFPKNFIVRVRVMFSYEKGVLISFIFYCYYIFNLLVTINSKAERNLNKVGERFSWLTLSPKLMTASDFDRPLFKKIGKFFLIASCQGIFIFLSWINVFINIAFILYRYRQDSGAPQAVKDFRWKLRNYDMTFDELVVELIKVRGLSLEDFESVKAEFEQFVAERRLS